LPAEIRVTASYLDRDGNLICTGTVPDVATQRRLTDSFNLEIRPWNLRGFIHWSNEPQAVNPPRSFACLGPDGLTQTSTLELERVESLLIYTTLLPSGGGVSTTQFRIDLVR
jgi:hypothetical protein